MVSHGWGCPKTLGCHSQKPDRVAHGSVPTLLSNGYLHVVDFKVHELNKLVGRSFDRNKCMLHLAEIQLHVELIGEQQIFRSCL